MEGGRTGILLGEAAEADLMANVSMMLSAACSAKRDLIRSWEWHAHNGRPEWDTNYLRLTTGLENVQGAAPLPV